MFVVFGVTGNTGKVVAESLLAAGKPVRVVVRSPEQGASWKARGAEVAVATLEDGASVERALAGASGAYALLPPGLTSTAYVAERTAMGETLARAAKKAGVGHIVLLSSVGAHLPAGTGPIVVLHRAERALAAAGVPTTAVRASYFLENFGGVLPAVKGDGVLPTFMPADLAIDVVTTEDIGRTAAQALLDGPRGQRVIELSGPAPVSARQVAATLGKLLGKQVNVIEAPIEAVVPTFTSMGMSSGMAELYREMIAGFNAGQIGYEGGKAERVKGKVEVETALRGMLG